jgi:endo-1,4-beta-xylanase
MKSEHLLALIGLALAVLVVAGCAGTKTTRKAADKRGLAYGTAIQPGDILWPESAQLLAQDFNTLVPENVMKWGLLRPTKTFWNWSDLDKMVEFAEKNGMKMRGHTFVWHSQNPPYVNSLKTRDEAIALMTEQITEVMTRYKGRIAEYDVANEVVADNGTMRDTVWLKAIGSDYLDIAFRTARAADPAAKLILNDYSNEYAGDVKADAFYNLAKDLKERGVPIDGVGFQLHIEAQWPVRKDALVANIRRFAELGLAVSFTEIDVRIKMPVDAQKEAEQVRAYEALLDAALGEPNVKSFILWGYTDKQSWVPGFFGGYGSALIYDTELKPKAAYRAILQRLLAK